MNPNQYTTQHTEGSLKNLSKKALKNICNGKGIPQKGSVNELKERIIKAGTLCSQTTLNLSTSNTNQTTANEEIVGESSTSYVIPRPATVEDDTNQVNESPIQEKNLLKAVKRLSKKASKGIMKGIGALNPFSTKKKKTKDKRPLSDGSAVQVGSAKKKKTNDVSSDDEEEIKFNMEEATYHEPIPIDQNLIRDVYIDKAFLYTKDVIPKLLEAISKGNILYFNCLYYN
jgi:hypothetical protein